MGFSPHGRRVARVRGDVSLQIVEELNKDSLQEQHAEAAAEFDVDRCDLCARVRARAHV